MGNAPGTAKDEVGNPELDADAAKVKDGSKQPDRMKRPSAMRGRFKVGFGTRLLL